MEPRDLELYTTRQLIEELMRRRTFLGVVIHAEDEERGRPWVKDKNFRVHYNANLDVERTGRLLETIAGHIERMSWEA